MTDENKHLVASGLINLYTGIITGKTYWEINIELPLDLKPNAIFREFRIVPQLTPPTPLITDYAWAFRMIGRQFIKWADYLDRKGQ